MVWVVLIAMAIIVFPAALDIRHSEHVKIQVQNKTNAPVRAALLCSNGDVFGETLAPSAQSSFTVFKGEFRDTDFPGSLRVLILDPAGNTLYNTNHTITTRGRLMIERPFAITVDTDEEGKIDVNVQLWSETPGPGENP